MSETRRAALTLVADELKVLSVDSFEDRLILQKAIYLLQEVIGLDLGYHFSWYLRGPYCSEVAQDAFEVLQSQSVDTIKKTYQLTEEAKRLIAAFKKRIEARKPRTVRPSTWLELLSSLHYLIQHDPFVDKDNQEEVLNRLLELKPFLRNVGKDVLVTAWEIVRDGAEVD